MARILVIEDDSNLAEGLHYNLEKAGHEVEVKADGEGGLAAALNEIARHAQVGIELEEAAIPVAEPVAGACELLGLDPLYVANEGRLVAFVPAEAAEKVLEIMRSHTGKKGAGPICRDGPKGTSHKLDLSPFSSFSSAAIIGTVTAERPGTVELRGVLGGGRIVDLLSGEQMPRIC